MNEENKKMKEAILYLTRVVAMSEAREQKLLQGKDWIPEQFDIHVQALTREVENMLK